MRKDEDLITENRLSSLFPSDKEDILQEARRIVYGDRSEAYGHPRENMQLIADLWNVYINANVKINDTFENIKISAEDVAMLMILVKVARNVNKSKRDNLVDIAGYAAVADRVTNNE